MNKIKSWGIALALVSSFAVPAAASEYDNQLPGGWSPTLIQASFFTEKGHQWSVPENIGGVDWTGNPDTDHTLLTIPKTFAGCERIYSWISFEHSKGDLDMIILDAAGNELGRSQGVGDSESVYLPASAPKTVIVKVYGYQGAMGDYRIYVGCQ